MNGKNRLCKVKIKSYFSFMCYKWKWGSALEWAEVMSDVI